LGEDIGSDRAGLLLPFFVFFEITGNPNILLFILRLFAEELEN
jgi:hypothetical protein